jgi:hypothetical protein
MSWAEVHLLTQNQMKLLKRQMKMRIKISFLYWEKIKWLNKLFKI